MDELDEEKVRAIYGGSAPSEEAPAEEGGESFFEEDPQIGMWEGF